MRAAVRAQKGVRWRIEARKPYDALLESVPAPDDVTFEPGTVGDVSGVWVYPASSPPDRLRLAHCLHGRAAVEGRTDRAGGPRGASPRPPVRWRTHLEADTRSGRGDDQRLSRQQPEDVRACRAQCHAGGDFTVPLPQLRFTVHESALCRTAAGTALALRFVGRLLRHQCAIFDSFWARPTCSVNPWNFMGTSHHVRTVAASMMPSWH
jgi:hypothetical protein